MQSKSSLVTLMLLCYAAAAAATFGQSENEHEGAECGTRVTNCKTDCVFGQSENPPNSNNPIYCQVFWGGTTKIISWNLCVKSDSGSSTCSYTGNPYDNDPATCPSIKYKRCGEQEYGKCKFPECSCSGTPTGTTTMTARISCAT